MEQVLPAAADLVECDREPVHIPGTIQPFGCLIAFNQPNWTVAHASLNAATLFGKPSVDEIIGQDASTILSPKIIHDLRNVFQAAMISGFAERLATVKIGAKDEVYDILIHTSGKLAVAEFIPLEGAESMRAEPTALVKTIIDRLRRTNSFETFLGAAARQVRAVTGYDRVMIYRFLDDDSGQVVAEALRSGLTPFLHLRYPASDIPAQARALFKRQWLRLIETVDYEPVPIQPRLTPTGQPIDLSLSTLRSASPIHLEYLRNMGVGASLTVSIISGDRLWGLIACHHERPRRISAATSAAVELFAQVFSTQIESKQRQDELAYLTKARETHDRLMATMEPRETVFENLENFADLIQQIIPCDGIGVWTVESFDSYGTVPPRDAVDELIRFLNTKRVDRVFATSSLSLELPDAMRYVGDVSGLIAIPFSRTPRDYLLLFRREVIKTVEWGGDPNKAVQAGDSGRIGPRVSFDAWKETVRATSVAWLKAELSTAEMLRVSLLDVILRRASLIDRERRVAQETQLLLVAELNHRVKNVLAVIRSLVRQSRNGDHTLESFSDDLQSRIQALSVAHDQLTQSNWKAAPLMTLIEAEAQAWTDAGDSRLHLSGPPVMIVARAYQTLALVLHELMTNAAKYGALSVGQGRLSVTWQIEESGALAIAWREENGPPVKPRSRRGFGSIVVEQSIPFELQGDAQIEHLPEGVRARFLIPADFVETKVTSLPKRREFAGIARADLRGKSLLLVEDSMMIALDAQSMLQGCGAEVELVATTNDARRALKLNTFDAAILDVDLYTETSYGIAEDLQERGIPFVFVTGYGETINVPDRFVDVPVISKPYAEDVLRAALAA